MAWSIFFHRPHARTNWALPLVTFAAWTAPPCLREHGEICRPAAIDTLNAKARRIVVATHSPLHDGTILALFRTNGWTLEAWDPWVVPEPDEAQRDGTQVWSNPRVPVVRGALARAWEVLRGRRA